MPSSTASSPETLVITVEETPSTPSPGSGYAPAASSYSGGVVIRGALWRFLVTDLDTVSITNLERLAIRRSVLAQRGAPWQASGDVPSDSPQINILHSDGYPYLDEGNRLLYGFRREAGGLPKWVCRFGGVIMNVADGGQQNPARTTYTAYDPWQYLNHRPALGCDFTDPDTPGTPNQRYPGQAGFRISARPGTLIALQMLYNSITASDVNGVAFIDLPPEYGGTGAYSGTIEETEVIDPWLVEQGESVADVWNKLVATGTIDIVLRPVYDPLNRPGITSELSIYNRAGVSRPGAVMAWDRPGRSLVGMTRTVDGTQRANIVKVFAGQGGAAGGGEQTDPTSVALFREYVLQQFLVGQTDAMVEALVNQILSLRSRGLETYTLSPAAERSASPLLEYEPGDTIPVHASANLRVALDDDLRVESIPIEIDDNGVESVRNMLVSTDLTVAS